MMKWIFNIKQILQSKLFYLFSIYFFLIFGNVLGINIGNSLFLSSPFGGINKLPLMYIAFAFLTSLISFSFIILLDKIRKEYFFILVSIVVGLFPLLFTIFQLNFKNKFWTYGIYLFVQIIWQISIMFFWAIANDLCNTREAKKIFPLTSSGGLTGSILSGFISGVLLLVYPVKFVFLIWTATSSIIIFLFILLQKKFPFPSGQIGKKTVSITIFQSLRKTFFKILSTPFLIGLSLLVFNMWLTLYICDYYYFDITSKSISNQEKLASIYSLVRGTASFIAILLQLFITRKLLEKFGPANCVFIFPSILTSAILTNIIFPRWFLGGIILRTVRVSLVYSIQDSVYQVFFNIIGDNLRSKIRIFIDGIIIPISIATAGFFLMSFNTYKFTDTLFITIPLLIFWFFSAFILKKNYLNQLIANLSSSYNNELKFITLEQLTTLKSPQTLQIILQAIENDPTPSVKINALKLLKNYPYSSTIFEVLKNTFVKCRDPFVKTAIIQTLGIYKTPEVTSWLVEILNVEKVERVRSTTIKILAQIIDKTEVYQILKNFLHQMDERTQANAIEIIGELKLDGFKEELIHFLSHNNNRIRANTVITIFNTPFYSDLKEKSLQTLKEMLRSNSIFMQVSALYAISTLKLKQFIPEILHLLKNSINNDLLFRNILRTIVPLKIKNFLPKILSDKNHFPQELLSILANYFPEEDQNWCVKEIEKALKEKAIEKINKFLPCIPYLGKSALLLEKLLLINDENIICATLQIIRKQNLTQYLPYIKKNFLFSSSERIRIEALKTLYLLSKADFISHLPDFLKDPSDRVRSSTLDTIFSFKISLPTNLLLPLLNDKNDRVKATAAKILLSQFQNSQGKLTLLQMYRCKDKWTKINAIYAMGDTKCEEFLPYLLQSAKDSDLDIQKNAIEAIKKIQNISSGENKTSVSLLKNFPENNKIIRFLTKILFSPEDPIKLLEEEKEIDSKTKAILKEILNTSSSPIPSIFNEKLPQTLSQIENKDILFPLIHSEDPYIRQSAFQTLILLNTKFEKTFIETLIEREIEQWKNNQNVMKKFLDLENKFSHLSLFIEELKNINLIIKDNIFSILSLHWDKEKLSIINSKLEDSNSKIRANALEAMETIIDDKNILGKLLPFFEKVYFSSDPGKEKEPLNFEDIKYVFNITKYINPSLKKWAFFLLREVILSEIIFPLLKLSQHQQEETKKLAQQLLEDIQEMLSLPKISFELDNISLASNKNETDSSIIDEEEKSDKN